MQPDGEEAATFLLQSPVCPLARRGFHIHVLTWEPPTEPHLGFFRQATCVSSWHHWGLWVPGGPPSLPLAGVGRAESGSGRSRRLLGCLLHLGIFLGSVGSGTSGTFSGHLLLHL